MHRFATRITQEQGAGVRPVIVIFMDLFPLQEDMEDILP